LIASCASCGYAANLEKATSRLSPIKDLVGPDAPEEFPTPGVRTIEDLEKFPGGAKANAQIKTLVYVADSKPVLILVRGDDQLNEAKLAGVLGTPTFRPAEAAEIFDALGAHPGSLGAVKVTKFSVYADERLRGANDMTTGANEDGFHFRSVSIDRDVQITKWADLRVVGSGEPCKTCGKPLKIRRAIEVGHVFKLGTKYSEKLNASFLAEDGSRRPCIMGCYGIGVTRTLQAVIEQCNDANGIAWPVSVAPYTVCITPLNVSPDGPVMAIAGKIYEELNARGVDVIIDDRDDRPGVKFKDSELVGFPIRIGIGEKSLAKGEVEIKPRLGELIPVKPEEAVEKVLALIKEHTPA